MLAAVKLIAQRPDASADSVARLDDRHGGPALLERAGGRQAGETRARDYDARSREVS